MDDLEYKANLDDQVVRFLDIRHKHTYFLVTAAIVVLGFVLNFAVSNQLLSQIPPFPLLLISVGAISSLAVAGAALWSLSLDNASFLLHLRYRHERKEWTQIPPTQQREWTRVNKLANFYRNAAFFLLVVGVGTNAWFLVLQMMDSKGREIMHHYGEDSTEIVPQNDHYEVIFTNKETGQKIRMRIPRVGVREDPSRGLTNADVKQLSDEVNDVLRRHLQ